MPGSVKDNLEVIYPWLQNTSQETTSPIVLIIVAMVGQHIELNHVESRYIMLNHFVESCSSF